MVSPLCPVPGWSSHQQISNYISYIMGGGVVLDVRYFYHCAIVLWQVVEVCITLRLV